MQELYYLDQNVSDNKYGKKYNHITEYIEWTPSAII